MGMIPKNFFGLYVTPPSEEEYLPIMRNSEDFFPNIEESHFPHIFSNTFNCLFTGNFPGVTPDWDMFQSKHDWGEFHAAARAISGGPIYITDIPLAHNTNIINKLIAQQCDGDWYILRSHRPPLPTLDNLFVDPKIIPHLPLKIFNLHWTEDKERNRKDEWGILGAWSQQINEGEVAVTNFSLKDVSYLFNTNKNYAVYFMSSEFAKKINSVDETFPILIPAKGCEIATFAPLKSTQINNSEVEIGCFGLIDKYNCSQPIYDIKLTESSNSVSYQVKLKAISEACGFYLNINLPTTQYKLSAKIDEKLISEEKIEQEIGSNLVVVNFTEKVIFQEVEEEKMENFIVVLKVDFCG